MMAIALSLDDLESLISKAISDYKKIHGNICLVINDELYWRIPDAAVSNFEKKPSEFEVGNYQQEIEFLERKRESGDLVGSESLIFLAALMQRLSAQE